MSQKRAPIRFDFFFQGVANLGPKSRQNIVRARLGHDPQSFFQWRLLDHGQSGSSDRRRPAHSARTAHQCCDPAPKQGCDGVDRKIKKDGIVSGSINQRNAAENQITKWLHRRFLERKLNDGSNALIEYLLKIPSVASVAGPQQMRLDLMHRDPPPYVGPNSE